MSSVWIIALQVWFSCIISNLSFNHHRTEVWETKVVIKGFIRAWRSSFWREVGHSEPRTTVGRAQRRSEQRWTWWASWYARARCCSRCRRRRWYGSCARHPPNPTRSCRGRDATRGTFCCHRVCGSCGCVAGRDACWPLDDRARTSSSCAIAGVCHPWRVVYAISHVKYL